MYCVRSATPFGAENYKQACGAFPHYGMQVKFRVEAASVAVHRHHRDSDQASPDSADADQSCRRHIQTGPALLSVPVLACKMQHMQQSLQMMSDMRNLRRLHERARNSA